MPEIILPNTSNYVFLNLPLVDFDYSNYTWYHANGEKANYGDTWYHSEPTELMTQKDTNL